MRSLLNAASKRHPFIGITCDICQDDFRRISYLGATANFYNENMSLCDQINDVFDNGNDDFFDGDDDRTIVDCFTAVLTHI